MKQNGFILVVSLIFLAIMTMLGISMFGGFASDETMSGNYREKSRSIDAAQTALNYAQNWLTLGQNTYTGNWVTGVTCDINTVQPAVCQNALSTLSNPIMPPWVSYASYQPAGIMSVDPNVQGFYAGIPNYYIQYIGSIDLYNALYQVTATAYGGNASTIAVLQTVYQVHATATYLGGG